MERIIIIILMIVEAWMYILGIILGSAAVQHNKIAAQYKEQKKLAPEWERKAVTLWKKVKILCSIMRWHPLGNDSLIIIYNTLSYMLATTELLDGNTKEFIKIATEANQSFSGTYEVLPFLLALYYNAEGDWEMAEKYYRSYLLCDHEKKNMQIVMQKLFSDTEVDETKLKKVLQEVWDPATMKLFQENKLIN